VYYKLLQPQYKRLFKVYRDAGWHMMMHSCGCITQFLPDLIDIGLDYIEPVQPCMGLEFIKKEYGKDLTFQGGIDTQHLLPFGTPDEVRTESARVIHLLGKGGGHVIAPAQEVMKDVPLANIVALLETIVEERGKAIA
jgi:uroporphyrinogen decarboxylase